MKRKTLSLILVLLTASTAVSAQTWTDSDGSSKLELTRDVYYGAEIEASVANNHTPLWLHANRYGLSSLERNNGYLRASIIRPLSVDSVRRWAIGYGIDVALTYHHTARAIVQQAFLEARWLHGVLSVGSKEYPMQLKNNSLSSGSQTLGINARPVPQVRLALPDYWTLPFGRGFLHLKGHVAYGRKTDDNWQRQFTGSRSKHTEASLYHSKAGYLMIGNPDRFMPLSLELGLEMAAEFGGTSYVPNAEGKLVPSVGKGGLRGMIDALIPGGADTGETTYQNVSGNQLGSWMFRLNYDADNWTIRLYGDKFFEDHSAMLFVDYDGYGTGDAWSQKQRRRYLLYDFKDMMLGTELNMKYGRWLRDIVVEYVYSKYQSGPIYHDHTKNIADHIGGVDDYYNHYIYPGWQHWGQVMGNPLYRSPLYNDNGKIEVRNNRFTALHLGLAGQPSERLAYRLLATWQEGLGTYPEPYTRKRHNVSLMVEAAYRLQNNWKITGSCAADFGSILGRSYGLQLKISKSGLLKL